MRVFTVDTGDCVPIGVFWFLRVIGILMSQKDA